MSPITIYTDGSALGNPGPGGYGVVLLSGPHRKELSQGFRLTTNNRMELMAVCVALEALRSFADGLPAGAVHSREELEAMLGKLEKTE